MVLSVVGVHTRGPGAPTALHPARCHAPTHPAYPRALRGSDSTISRAVTSCWKIRGWNILWTGGSNDCGEEALRQEVSGWHAESFCPPHNNLWKSFPHSPRASNCSFHRYHLTSFPWTSFHPHVFMVGKMEPFCWNRDISGLFVAVIVFVFVDCWWNRRKEINKMNKELLKRNKKWQNNKQENGNAQRYILFCFTRKVIRKIKSYIENFAKSKGRNWGWSYGSRRMWLCCGLSKTSVFMSEILPPCARDQHVFQILLHSEGQILMSQMLSPCTRE